MDLFAFLCLSVLFSALVMVVTGRGGSREKIVPALLIAIELWLLLQTQGVVDEPVGSESSFRAALSSLAALAALVDFFRAENKAFPLLAVYASLLQVLASLDVIEGISL